MFKAAARTLPPFSQLGLWTFLAKVCTTPLILAALLTFLVSALLWLLAIRKVNLSLAYPAASVSYIIIFLGSHLLFQEQVTWRHWAGAGLIACGITLVASQR